MAMHRSYAASHKGLRNILGQFSLLAGRTDYGSQADVKRLKALGEEMFMLLTHHLHTENDHLLALLEQRVLGFRLVDEPEQGAQGYKIGPEFKPDDPFVLGSYCGALVETLLYPSSNYQVRSDEDERMTISLHCHGLSVIDFASITGDIQRAMYDRAETKTKRISEAYERTLSRLL